MHHKHLHSIILSFQKFSKNPIINLGSLGLGLEHFERLHKMVIQGQSRLSEANLASSESNDESLGKSRLEFACISLTRDFIWTAFWESRLSEKYLASSEASSGQFSNYDFLSPFSSKNPILIPQSPKMN